MPSEEPTFMEWLFSHELVKGEYRWPCPITGLYGWVCPFTGWRAPYSFVYERIREALPVPSNPSISHDIPRQTIQGVLF